MKTGALRATKDYSVFQVHEFNRDVRKTGRLEASMRKHGFIDAYPLHVVRDRKKLKVKAGHHRLYAAQKVGVPVKFVVCADKAEIHELEGASRSWSLLDYLVAFVRRGFQDYIEVKEYMERTGIGITNSVSMLGGESAGSSNKVVAFKRGTYKIADTKHAGIVAGIVLHCKSCGVPFSVNSIFVQAISRLVWLEEFEPELLKHKISTFPYLLEKRANLVGYTEMLDALYNRQQKEKLPLAFLADAAARKRSAIA